MRMHHAAQIHAAMAAGYQRDLDSAPCEEQDDILTLVAERARHEVEKAEELQRQQKQDG